MLRGMFLAAMGYAITHTNALPRWTGRTAYALALINFAFIPSMFFGSERAADRRRAARPGRFRELVTVKPLSW